MRFQAHRLAVLLSPMLLVAACGSNVRHATRDLNDRLQTQLGTNIAAGQVAVRPLSTGAQVTLTDPVVFSNGGAGLDGRGQLVLASVVEGLLDPSLLQIQVADTRPTPANPTLASAALAADPSQDSLQAARVHTVTQYLVEAGLGPALQPPGTTPPTGVAPGAIGPAGLTFTIAVQCPDRSGPPGYGSGKKEPACR